MQQHAATTFASGCVLLAIAGGGGHRNNRGHTNKTEKTKEHHTHLNVNAFFWLFAIEHPLDVELGTSGVLMYRRSDFLPLTGDNHVRI